MLNESSSIDSQSANEPDLISESRQEDPVDSEIEDIPRELADDLE